MSCGTHMPEMSRAGGAEKGEAAGWSGRLKSQNGGRRQLPSVISFSVRPTPGPELLFELEGAA